MKDIQFIPGQFERQQAGPPQGMKSSAQPGAGEPEVLVWPYLYGFQVPVSGYIKVIPVVGEVFAEEINNAPAVVTQPGEIIKCSFCVESNAHDPVFEGQKILSGIIPDLPAQS
jgi:hypothetical protein